MTRIRQTPQRRVFGRISTGAIALVSVVAAVAVVVPGAFATNPGDEGGGGYVSCQANGRTPDWSGINTPVMGGCQSYRSGFYAYKAGAGTNCQAIGYVAHVYYVDNNNNWHERWWGGAYCLNGVWHYSNSPQGNERRVSSMQINAGGVDWWMIQYRLA